MKKITLLSFIALLVISLASCGSGSGDANNNNTNAESVSGTHEGHEHATESTEKNTADSEHHNMGSKIEKAKANDGLQGTYVAKVFTDHALSGGTKMYFDGNSKVSFESEKYTSYKIVGTHVQIDMKPKLMVFKISGDSLILVDTLGTLIYVKQKE